MVANLGIALATLAGCGAATGVPIGPRGSDAAAMTTDAGLVALTDAATRDAAASDRSACETLVLALVGCSSARLAECVREYEAVTASARAIIDADAACFRASYATVGVARWPSDPSQCSVAQQPALLSFFAHWFHGGCQNENTDVARSVSSDPTFPQCGTGMTPVCFFGGTLRNTP